MAYIDAMLAELAIPLAEQGVWAGDIPQQAIDELADVLRRAAVDSIDPAERPLRRQTLLYVQALDHLRHTAIELHRIEG